MDTKLDNFISKGRPIQGFYWLTTP